jgi:flagellar biosynthesis/type III secretory pathway protein FliH
MEHRNDFARRGSGRVLFAEDFDQAPAPLESPEPEVIAPSFSAAELDAARAEAWQAGNDAATAAAAAADHAAIRATLTAIAAQFAGSDDALRALAEQSAAAIARLLLASLGAVLPVLAARYGEAELQAILRALLPGLFKEPAITVRINPRHHAALAVTLEQLDPDLAQRVTFAPSDALAPGDARIAWRHGGATRDAAALWAQVLAILDLSGLAPDMAPHLAPDMAPDPAPHLAPHLAPELAPPRQVQADRAAAAVTSDAPPSAAAVFPAADAPPFATAIIHDADARTVDDPAHGSLPRDRFVPADIAARTGPRETVHAG